MSHEELKISSLFDFDDADFRLRSSDHVTFKVHRVILTSASDVFNSMLSIPQPVSCSDDITPCVDMAENAVVLEHLLQFIYPMKSPNMLSFNQYVDVLEAASKYAIEGTIDALRVLLLSPRVDAERKSTHIRPCLAECDPLRAYAIAVSMGWKAEAIHASNLSLRANLNLAASSTELDNMPTKYYRWLNELHEDRRIFFKRLFEEFDDEPSEYRNKKCKDCGLDPLRLWWDDYIQRASSSVTARPLGDHVFDLNVLFPPDEDFDSFGCLSCPSMSVPVQTLYALSKLKSKLAKKKDNVRHKYMNPPSAVPAPGTS